MQRKAAVGAKLGSVRNLSALRAQLSSFSTIANRTQEQQQQHEKVDLMLLFCDCN